MDGTLLNRVSLNKALETRSHTNLYSYAHHE